MRFVIAALAACLIASPALAGPTQFDLVCTGTEKDIIKGTTGPWATRYSIDIDAHAYCETAACGAAQPIQEVQPGAIIFEKKKSFERLIGESDDWMEVSRTSGQFQSHHITALIFAQFVEAKCDVAPFTPFPPLKF